MPLSADELAILSRLLDEAMDLEQPALESWLEGLVEHFPGSKAMLRKLLEQPVSGQSAGFLGSLPKFSLAEAGAPSATGTQPLEPGTQIGNYRLVRKIGHGGMGQVWLAEQTDPVRRSVALKLISSGMYDASIVQRFKAERQSLAIMDHPTIAKVFDAGSTPEGQPYFVMEYVPGEPITEYCDRHRLTIAQRIELLIRVCEGVQHAHQKAIIHRDLKPANILIVDVDGRAEPRIIDFGLAKPTMPQVLPERTEHTQVWQFIGTPGYMSPEQVDSRNRGIDTRTDVYSLGVILYVLLTGLLPFEARRQQPREIDQWLRQLREEDPPNPSAKVSADRESAAANAAARSSERQPLVRLLRGDLDCIVMKALERDRERRYGSPSELADDLRRYLHDEPVSARPASATYRLLKYARRHRVAASIAAGLVVLITAFTVLQAIELRRTTRERDRATRITDFMTRMFEVSDPSEARGRNVTAREILDKAAGDIAQGLVDDSEVQSQMLNVMATTYLNLGLYSRAQKLVEQALKLRLRVYGANNRVTLASSSQLGWILDREGHPADAEKWERQVLEVEQRTLGSEDSLTLETMDHLTVILEDEGRHSDAEKLARQVVEAATRKLGPTHTRTLMATNHLALALLNQSRYAEAEKEYRRLIEIDRRVLGPDHPQSLPPMVNLALAVEDQGRTAEAEQLYREVLALQQRVLGPEHQFTLLTMNDLAALLLDVRQYAQAETLFRQVLEMRARTLGPEHRDTLESKSNVAYVLLKEGRVHEAESLTRETLAAQARVLGASNPGTLNSQSNLAAILNQEGKYLEARSIAAETLPVQRRLLGPLHSDTIDTLRELGRALAYTDRYAEASALFREAIGQSTGSSQGNPWSVWYAFAAVAAAADRRHDALRYLQEAAHRGYDDSEGLSADDEFVSLRSDPEFQALLAGLKSPGKAGT